MAEPVKGKVQMLLEMLETGNEYTLDELVAQSGASIGTAKMQVNYLLKKNGKTVKVNEVGGVKKYSLVK